MSQDNSSAEVVGFSTDDIPKFQSEVNAFDGKTQNHHKAVAQLQNEQAQASQDIVSDDPVQQLAGLSETEKLLETENSELADINIDTKNGERLANTLKSETDSAQELGSWGGTDSYVPQLNGFTNTTRSDIGTDLSCASSLNQSLGKLDQTLIDHEQAVLAADKLMKYSPGNAQADILEARIAHENMSLDNLTNVLAQEAKDSATESAKIALNAPVSNVSAIAAQDKSAASSDDAQSQTIESMSTDEQQIIVKDHGFSGKIDNWATQLDDNSQKRIALAAQQFKKIADQDLGQSQKLATSNLTSSQILALSASYGREGQVIIPASFDMEKIYHQTLADEQLALTNGDKAYVAQDKTLVGEDEQDYQLAKEAFSELTQAEENANNAALTKATNGHSNANTSAVLTDNVATSSLQNALKNADNQLMRDQQQPLSLAHPQQDDQIAKADEVHAYGDMKDAGQAKSSANRALTDGANRDVPANFQSIAKMDGVLDQKIEKNFISLASQERRVEANAYREASYRGNSQDVAQADNALAEADQGQASYLALSSANALKAAQIDFQNQPKSITTLQQLYQGEETVLRDNSRAKQDGDQASVAQQLSTQSLNDAQQAHLDKQDKDNQEDIGSSNSEESAYEEFIKAQNLENKAVLHFQTTLLNAIKSNQSQVQTLQQKLTKAQLNLKTAQNSLQDTQTSLGKLKKDNTAQGGTIADLNKQVSQKENEVAAKEAEISKDSGTIAKLQKELDLDNKVIPGDKAKIETADKQFNTLEGKYNELSKQSDDQVSQIKQLKTELAEEEIKLGTSEDENASLGKQVSDLTTKNTALNKQVSADKESAQKTAKNVDALQGQLKSVTQNYNDDQTALKGDVNTISQLRNDKSTLTSELNTAIAGENADKKTIEGDKTQAGQLSQELQADKASIDYLTGENETLNKDIGQLQAQLKAAQDDGKKKAGEIGTLQTRIQTITQSDLAKDKQQQGIITEQVTQIKALKLQLAGEQAKDKTDQSTIAQDQQVLKQNSKDIDELNTKNAKLKDDVNGLGKTQVDLQGQLDTANQIAQTEKTTIGNLKTMIDTLNQSNKKQAGQLADDKTLISDLQKRDVLLQWQLALALSKEQADEKKLGKDAGTIAAQVQTIQTGNTTIQNLKTTNGDQQNKINELNQKNTRLSNELAREQQDDGAKEKVINHLQTRIETITHNDVVNAQKEKAKDTHDKQQIDALGQKLHELKQELAGERANEKAQSDAIARDHNDIMQFKQTIQNDNGKIKDLDTRNIKLHSDMSSLAAANTKVGSQLAGEQKIAGDEKKTIDALNTSITTLKAHQQQQSNEITKDDGLLAQLRSENTKLDSDLSSAQAQEKADKAKLTKDVAANASQAQTIQTDTKTITDIGGKNGKLQDEVNALKKEMAGLNSQLALKEADAGDDTKTIKQLQTRIHTITQKDIVNGKAQKGKDAEEQKQIDDLSQKVKALQKKLANEVNQEGKDKASLEDDAQKIRQSSQTIQKDQQDITQLNAKNMSLENDNNELNHENEKLKEQVAADKKNASQTQNTIDQLNTTVQVITKGEQDKDNKINTDSGLITQLKGENTALEGQLSSAQAQERKDKKDLAHEADTISQQSQALQTDNAKITNLGTQDGKLHDDIKALKKENGLLNKELADAQADEGQKTKTIDQLQTRVETVTHNENVHDRQQKGEITKDDGLLQTLKGQLSALDEALSKEKKQVRSDRDIFSLNGGKIDHLNRKLQSDDALVRQLQTQNTSLHQGLDDAHKRDVSLTSALAHEKQIAGKANATIAKLNTTIKTIKDHEMVQDGTIAKDEGVIAQLKGENQFLFDALSDAVNQKNADEQTIKEDGDKFNKLTQAFDDERAAKDALDKKNAAMGRQVGELKHQNEILDSQLALDSQHTKQTQKIIDHLHTRIRTINHNDIIRDKQQSGKIAKDDGLLKALQHQMSMLDAQLAVEEGKERSDQNTIDHNGEEITHLNDVTHSDKDAIDKLTRQNASLDHHIETLSDDKTDLKSQILGDEHLIDQAHGMIGQLQTRLQTVSTQDLNCQKAQQAMIEADKKLMGEIEQENSQLQGKLAQDDHQQNVDQHDIEVIKGQNHHYTKELAHEKMLIKDVRDQVTHYKQVDGSDKQELSRLDQDLQTQKQAFQTTQDKYLQDEKQISALEGKLSQDQQHINEDGREIETLDKHNTSLQNGLAKADRQNEEEASEIKSTHGMIAKDNRIISHLEQEVSDEGKDAALHRNELGLRERLNTLKSYEITPQYHKGTQFQQFVNRFAGDYQKASHDVNATPYDGKTNGLFEKDSRVIDHDIDQLPQYSDKDVGQVKSKLAGNIQRVIDDESHSDWDKNGHNDSANLAIAQQDFKTLEEPHSPDQADFDYNVLSHDNYLMNRDANTLCFCTGTKIKTTHGEQAVCQLKPGDWVINTKGVPKQIQWIGKREIPTSEKSPNLPIRIKKDAFDVGLPYDDLYVSPAHALGFEVREKKLFGLLGEGKRQILVRAASLVNNENIKQVKPSQKHYWHVELEKHDLLYANGVWAESFYDKGERELFDESFGEASIRKGAMVAPRFKKGPLVNQVRDKIAQRLTEISSC